MVIYTGGFNSGETKEFLLGDYRRGRYLYIQLMDRNYLSLCEVEAFAASKSIQFSLLCRTLRTDSVMKPLSNPPLRGGNENKMFTI